MMNLDSKRNSSWRVAGWVDDHRALLEHGTYRKRLEGAVGAPTARSSSITGPLFSNDDLVLSFVVEVALGTDRDSGFNRDFWRVFWMEANVKRATDR